MQFNMQQMMKQAQAMQSKIGELQEKMQAREIEGASGGGMVKVLITGKSEMKKLDIDPSLIDPNEKEMLEDLIIAAFNDAKAKMESSYQDEMGKMMQGMGLPPGMKLPF